MQLIFKVFADGQIPKSLYTYTEVKRTI